MSESAKYDPARHHPSSPRLRPTGRRSIRLKGHDYAGGGIYFVTICAHREAGAIFAAPVAREILSRIWEEICLQAGAGMAYIEFSARTTARYLRLVTISLKFHSRFLRAFLRRLHK